MHKHSGELGNIARRWFEVMRACGDDPGKISSKAAR
jgi:hypothetical protein